VIRSFLATGVLLVLLGVGLLGYVVVSRPDLHQTSDTSLVGDQQGVQAAPPSRFWALAAGLSLAVGAGCIGVGMNRWKR
jgi:hypothetical protein